MYRIQITSAAVQEQSFSLYEMNLRLTLYYNQLSRCYQFDLFDLDKNQFITQLKGLSVSSPALLEFNLPFVLVLKDKSELGIGSISQTDFANRFALLIMTREEYRETVRTRDTT